MIEETKQDVNAQTKLKLNTPLHVAVFNQQLLTILFLSQSKGINIYIQNIDQNSPLNIAEKNFTDTNYVKLVKTLLENQYSEEMAKEMINKYLADINAKNE